MSCVKLLKLFAKIIKNNKVLTRFPNFRIVEIKKKVHVKTCPTKRHQFNFCLTTFFTNINLERISDASRKRAETAAARG